MKYMRGDATVGDVGVPITAVADVDLTGKQIYFHILKPNGEIIIRQATVSQKTATYTTVADDLDIPGQWIIFVRDESTGYFFTNESGNIIEVRPRPDAMAKG